MRRSYEMSVEVLPGKAAPSFEAECRLLRRALRNEMVAKGDWPDSDTWVQEALRHPTREDGLVVRVQCLAESHVPDVDEEAAP